MSKLSLIALPLALSLLHVQPANAKTCINDDGTSRWRNYLTYCEVVSTNCTDTSKWTFGQWSTYWNAQYKASPEEACKALFAKKQNLPHTAAQKALTGIIRPVDSAGNPILDPDYWYCSADWDLDGDVEWGEDWSHAAFIIDRVTESAEPMCDLTPRGPYRPDGPNPVTTEGTQWWWLGAGKPFTDTIKTRVKTANQTKYGVSGTTYVSDAYDYSGPQTDHIDPYKYLDTTGGPLLRPQIDHIIPRVDIKGCACGPNTPENAIVISAQLNRLMSNNSQHPARIVLLQHFTTQGQQRVVDGDDTTGDESDIDEASLDEAQTDEIGGCSTSGASGGLGLGLVALALRRRRRA